MERRIMLKTTNAFLVSFFICTFAKLNEKNVSQTAKVFSDILT